MKTIQGWWLRFKLRNAKQSSGHLDPSARSAEFHRLKGKDRR